jgi:hypothetical protein
MLSSDTYKILFCVMLCHGTDYAPVSAQFDEDHRVIHRVFPPSSSPAYENATELDTGQEGASLVVDMRY